VVKRIREGGVDRSRVCARPAKGMKNRTVTTTASDHSKVSFDWVRDGMGGIITQDWVIHINGNKMTNQQQLMNRREVLTLQNRER